MLIWFYVVVILVGAVSCGDVVVWLFSIVLCLLVGLLFSCEFPCVDCLVMIVALC